jgi:transposase
LRLDRYTTEKRIEAHVFVCVLSLLMAMLFEKFMNDEITMSMISDMLSGLNVA